MPVKDITRVCVLVVFCSITAADAQPIVIYDGGNTIDIESIDSSLLEPLKFPGQRHGTDEDALSDSNVPEPAGNVRPEASLVFPLKVRGMSVARVSRTSVNYPELTAPVCVIGSDDKSLSWLVSYYDQLVELRVKCLLVQVADQDELVRVSRYARDIPIMPDVGGLSKTLFKLEHYPVLISKNWVEQ